MYVPFICVHVGYSADEDTINVYLPSCHEHITSMHVLREVMGFGRKKIVPVSHDGLLIEQRVHERDIAFESH